MHTSQSARTGLQRLIDCHRRKFRIPENLDHYSPRDLERAERRYLKFVLGTTAHRPAYPLSPPPAYPSP